MFFFRFSSQVKTSFWMKKYRERNKETDDFLFLFFFFKHLNVTAGSKGLLPLSTPDVLVLTPFWDSLRNEEEKTGAQREKLFLKKRRR